MSRVVRQVSTRRRADAGMTLIELIVAMGVFTVVLAVFMAGVAMMTRSTVRTQVVADSGDAARTALQRFDRQVRYAESINFPGVGASGARYVEFRTRAVEAGTTPTCTQWRYVPVDETLQVRVWPDAPGASRGSWRTIASEVRDDPALTPTTYPFELQPAGDVHTRQQLTVRLVIGESDVSPGASSSSTFVARNSSDQSLSNADDDGDGQSDTQVCISAGDRP